MKVIAFDIGGKMAHFRKYYANNTALSYTIPPRTTLMGLLAAMLGRERDSYYRDLASDRLRIGIRVLSPLKKSFHRVNYLSLKSTGDLMKDNLGDFTGAGGRIQTPFEIVSGHNLITDFVQYRVYLAENTEGGDIFKEIEQVLKSRQSIYNLTLGAANFSASISKVHQYEAKEEKATDDFIAISSSIPSAAIEHFQMDDENFSMMSLEEELLPLDFIKHDYRELTNIGRFLFSTNGKSFNVQINRPFYRLMEVNTEGYENIFFLEK
jgi:CRISPR-associated protein Cas5h